MSLRILVVDDHPLVLRGIAAVLDSEPDFEVFEAAGTSEARKQTENEHPDVILLDVRLSEKETGVDFIPTLLRISPTSRVIMLTAVDDDQTVTQAFKAGAQGYMLKTASARHIRSAVRHVAAGFSHVDPAVSDALISEILQGNKDLDPPVTLSRREVDVLRLAASGLTNEQIAHRLGVTIETVKTHLSRAFVRLNANDRAHAVAISIREGLI